MSCRGSWRAPSLAGRRRFEACANPAALVTRHAGAQRPLPPHPDGRASLGAAVLNTSRQTGGALGVALLGSLAGPAGARMTLPMATVATAYLVALAATVRAIRL